MLHVKNLIFGYSDTAILNDINFSVYKGDKIGLIGRNGSGKSTLLRILNNSITYYRGSVEKEGKIEIAYLPQEIDFELHNDTAFGLVKNAFVHFDTKLQELHTLSENLGSESNAKQYDELLHYLVTNEGLHYEYKIGNTLHSLGFAEAEFHKPLPQMSGGYRVRAYLAYLLMKAPDILLLDEPTNYLDIDAIQFLINYLKEYDKSCIIISHDRHLLDAVTSKIYHLTMNKLVQYAQCNYSRFVIRRKQNLEQLIKQKENQDKKIEHLEAFVERFKAKATKATQAQSKIKQLEKIERIEINTESSLHFGFKGSGEHFSAILSCENLSFSYDTHEILKNVHFSILRNDAYFLIGRNGIGKTTFLKLLTGNLQPMIGNVTVHNNARIAYFPQNLPDQLNINDTVMESFKRSSYVSPMNETERRSYLGMFGFSGDDIDKKVEVLSGGEKVRLALATISTSKPDIMILDEPTTHLDIDTKDILIDALKKFDGALFIVSHDMDFTGHLAKKFLTLIDKNISVFGSIHDYFKFFSDSGKPLTSKQTYADTEKQKTAERLQKDEKLLQSVKNAYNFGKKPGHDTDTKNTNKNNNSDDNEKYSKNKGSSKELSKNTRLQLHKKIDVLMYELEEIENSMHELEIKMGKTTDFSIIKDLSSQYQTLKTDYDKIFMAITDMENTLN